MQLPFTVEQFFGVFETYNNAIWPAQIAAYVLGIIAVVVATRGGWMQSRIVSAIIALSWIWMGLVYHIMHFAEINPVARLFGGLFILQGILLIVSGCILGRYRFQFAAKPIPVVGILLIVYSMVIYPLLGTMFGHSYPRTPMFGVSPCPATIFTFGIFLLASVRVPIYVIIIPLLWSFVGTTAAAKLQVPQDYGLGVAGLWGTVLVVMNNRLQRDKKGSQ